MRSDLSIRRALIGAVFLVCVSAVAEADVLPTRHIVILDGAASAETLAAAFQKRMAQGADPQFIQEVQKYFESLGVLSVDDRIDQLRRWTQIRASVDTTNRTQLLVSQLLSVLIVDTVARASVSSRNAAAAEILRTEVLREFDKIMRSNERISDDQRLTFLGDLALQQDPGSVFRSVLGDAERDAAAAYQERWGKNVVAMQRAAKGRSDYPLGLKALTTGTPRRWKDLLGELRQDKVLKWVVAVDLYSFQVLLGVEMALERRDASWSMFSDPIWSSDLHVAKDGDPLDEVSVGTPPRNVLALQ